MSHVINEPVNRLIGRLPKIGIRPCVDGRRRGVRESLEDRTMAMARQAADLISGTLRHACGLPVECVIAETCIGGVAEAARCEDQFSRENVTATLSVTPSWCYGTETMDMNPLTVKAVWGFNGTERPGAVYLAAVMSAHAQRKLPAFAIYGRDVQDLDDTTMPDDVREKILLWAKAALAAGTMRGRSYVNIGGPCMGIAGSYVDAQMFQEYFGLRTEWLDQIEIERRVAHGIYDKAEYEKALAWRETYCPEGMDPNEGTPFQHSRADKDAEWERVVKQTLIIRDIMIGNPKLAEMGYEEEAAGRNAIAAGVQGQRQWTDHFPNHDFSEAILNSSFDWNGIREPFVLATENDTLNGMAMLLGHLVSDSASVFADVRTYWSPDAIRRVTGWQPEGLAEGGMIHLINSGAAALDGCGKMRDEQDNAVMKPFWEMTAADADVCLDATVWCPANAGYFRGGGFSSAFETQNEMPITMVRLNLIEGIGPVLQIAEGHTAVLPDEVSQTLQKRTDPTWPTTWFVPRTTGEGAFKDVYSVMANWGANHGSFNYGHIGHQLLTLCSMLRIPVSMHNVPDDRIYRPHAWAAFGTQDAESADYRACAAYGPIYG
ncbi:MAG: L-fucose isomerase [Eubacteriales bacterium]|nr:L-fucose isomerase [Eubacteriales bacterium]MDD4462275.1 L-fucose isomerase [Eubacteriales bacterium]